MFAWMEDGRLDPDAASLMLCEGLAVYLEARVLETLLKELRMLATVGTRLVVSLPLPVGWATGSVAGRRHQGRYGIIVSDVRQLDVGVFRVERRDGPAWRSPPDANNSPTGRQASHHTCPR